MKKSTKESKTSHDWKVMVLDGEDQIDNPDIDHELYDAFTYCLADVRITEYLYHLEVLGKLKRKLIKHAAMLAVSVTTLVMDLSIFFGWWI